MVDRIWQIAEEPLEGGRIGGVEGRDAHGSEVERGAGEVLGIAAGDDDIGGDQWAAAGS